MADTLAEIHNATLQSSDFNSSGEATLVTTDSSTKHVIKDVQIEEGDSNFKVEPYLNIGGFNTVQLTGNASGSEIVGPSSTIKLKSSTFPLRYQDYDFVNQISGSQYNAITFPRVNGQEGFTTNLNQTQLSIGHTNFTQNSNFRQIYFNLGPSNYQMLIDSNLNSNTRLYLRQSTGQLVTSYTNSYMPWWFDETQYAYRYNGSTNYIERLDCYTGTLDNQWHSFSGGGSNSTYSRMFGLLNIDGTTQYLFFWGEQSAYASYYDFSTDTAANFTNTGASSAFTDMSTQFYAIRKTSGDILIVNGNSVSELRIWNWATGTTYGSANASAYTSLVYNGGQQMFVTHSSAKQPVNNRLYYYADSGSPYSQATLAYVDFDKTGNAAWGTTGLTFQNATGSYQYGVNVSKSTPSASTISGRTYNISPSFKIRMTGITST